MEMLGECVGRDKTREFNSFDIVYTHRVCIEIHSVRVVISFRSVRFYARRILLLPRFLWPLNQSANKRK